MNDTPFPFERTTCACEGCRKCCKVQPGPLIPGDLQRIAEFLKLSVEEARKFFVASPGALVKQHGEVRRIGTITPKMRHSRCVFLDKNERCKIHPVAPAGCAYFDTHMSREQAMPRGIELAKRTQDPAYQAQRMQLPYTSSYKPRRY